MKTLEENAGMTQAVSQTPRDAREMRRASPRRRRVARWAAWVGVALLVVLVAVGTAAEYALHHAEPMLRERVIATLEDKFDSPVELDALHVSLLRGLEVSGDGLRVEYLGGLNKVRVEDLPPTLSVRHFAFHTGVLGLFERTMHVSTVRVEGMSLNIPPKPDRGPLVPHRQHKPGGKSIVVDTVVCSDMMLTIQTNKAGKLPLVFDIRNVTLHDVGGHMAFPFDAWLVNAKPIGDIHSTGHFGPWQGDDPRETPVDGSYSFNNADLGTIKGILGTLSSTGRYSGTLGKIGVTGKTETPDFALDVSEHPVSLHTEFNATVDGTSGDTILNAVHATLLHTVLEVNGKVVRASDEESRTQGTDGRGVGGQGAQGHFIDINVVSDQARVEDVLRLGAKTDPPIMQGAMTLKARIEIPPGHVSVTQKMGIRGTFTLRGVSFSNAKWQETLDKLSMRAQGHPKQANPEDAQAVTSQMSGRFTLAHVEVHVPELEYQMPGAQVHLTGTYALDGETFEFEGTVRTQATASQMLTGWKSVVAKPFDPLFKRDGAGLEIPVKISGTKSAPKLGVEFDKLFARHEGQGAQEPAQQKPAQHP
jgi:hypothetical protein